jgi:hypothetical protein
MHPSGDKNFDVASFVAAVRAQGVTPHVAQKVKQSAINGRTTRRRLCDESTETQACQGDLRLDETVGLLRRLRHRGGDRVTWIFRFTAAAFNLVRIRNLVYASS